MITKNKEYTIYSHSVIMCNEYYSGGYFFARVYQRAEYE